MWRGGGHALTAAGALPELIVLHRSIRLDCDRGPLASPPCQRIPEYPLR